MARQSRSSDSEISRDWAWASEEEAQAQREAEFQDRWQEWLDECDHEAMLEIHDPTDTWEAGL